MVGSKILASLAAVVGGIQVVYVFLLAVGVDMSQQLQDATTGLLGLVLIVAGIWFHPSTPIGPASGGGGHGNRSASGKPL